MSQELLGNLFLHAKNIELVPKISFYHSKQHKIGENFSKYNQCFAIIYSFQFNAICTDHYNIPLAICREYSFIKIGKTRIKHNFQFVQKKCTFVCPQLISIAIYCRLIHDGLQKLRIALCLKQLVMEFLMCFIDPSLFVPNAIYQGTQLYFLNYIFSGQSQLS